MKPLFDKTWKQAVLNGATSFGVTLTPLQADQLATHASELIVWNRKFNITAIVEPDKIASKHFIDSLAIVPHLPTNAKILDIGSGGGFPGLVIRITRPDTTVVMIDASRKKISFLSHLIRMLKLESCEAIHTRAESLLEDKAHFKGYDCVVSRAFSSLGSFSILAFGFLKPDGSVFAMKGKIDEKELLPVLESGAHISRTAYRLPSEGHERSIIKISNAP